MTNLAIPSYGRAGRLERALNAVAPNSEAPFSQWMASPVKSPSTGAFMDSDDGFTFYGATSIDGKDATLADNMSDAEIVAWVLRKAKTMYLERMNEARE